MDFFTMQYTYRNRYLVIKDGEVYVHKYGKCKFDPPFLSFKTKHNFLVDRKFVK